MGYLPVSRSVDYLIRRTHESTQFIPSLGDHLMKESQTTIPLLDRSLNDMQIPLDLWRDLAMRAIHEDKPVREILVEALRDRLNKPLRKGLIRPHRKDHVPS